MAASDPCHWGPVVVYREGGSILDYLVTGLARVALKPPVGFFTEGIAYRIDRHCEGLSLHRGKSTHPSWAMGDPMEAFPSCPAFTLLICHLPMWQLCTQMRCPSYLQLHFIALLVKSLSATSKFGLITTCE